MLTQKKGAIGAGLTVSTPHLPAAPPPSGPKDAKWSPSPILAPVGPVLASQKTEEFLPLKGLQPGQKERSKYK